MPTAGFFRRIFADFIDSLFVTLVILFISFFIGGLPEYIIRLFEVFLTFIYFPLLESSHWQRTIGQWFLNMYVCSTFQERLSFGRAFYRELTKFLLAIPLSIIITCELLLFFYYGNTYLPKDYVTDIAVITIITTGIIGGAVIYYVRIFNNCRQTMRDYFTKSMMMVKIILTNDS